MQPTIIAMTGAGGAMGQEAVHAILQSSNNHRIKALFLNTKKDKKVAKMLRRRYKSKIEIFYGDIVNYQDCLSLIEGAEYVIHMAALIPPLSDHNPQRTIATNFCGTVNMVDAVCTLNPQPKFVHVSTVAVYGNRNYKHPFVRVGDPLLPSAFDVYAASKQKAERYVMESKLDNWAVIRQTALLHKDFFANNVQDGLMFHTAWNTPLEWVTARDSGRLVKNIVEYDQAGRAEDFWKKCYNIGGGRRCRLTGYDTFDSGFGLIGGSAQDFFEPPWNQCRNFHGAWFLDSDALDDMFCYRQESAEDFWQQQKKSHPLYAMAKVLPKWLIKKCFIERLLKDENAPREWIITKDDARVKASYGCLDNVEMYPKRWQDYPLLCHGEVADGTIDYDEMRNSDRALSNGYYLSHGYNEAKPIPLLDIMDMQQAAQFRGGKCLSVSMQQGDLYTPLLWQCHNGHEFFMRPYTVLFGGHWCPQCTEPEPWQFDICAKSMPYFAQVWYDTHAKGENTVYYFEQGKARYYILDGDKKCTV